MRPLWTLRWLLLAILLWLWPVEQPSEEELIAYGKEQEREKPKVLHYSTGIHTIMYLNEHPELKRTSDEANAAQAQELQRYIDEHQSQPGPYEPPQQRTDAISLKEMRNAYHKAQLVPIDSMEMEAFVITEKRKVI